MVNRFEVRVASTDGRRQDSESLPVLYILFNLDDLGLLVLGFYLDMRVFILLTSKVSIAFH